MSFRFELASVLRIRQSLEDHEERVLGRISFEIAQNATAIEQNADELTAAGLLASQQIASASPAAELHDAYARIAALRAQGMALAEHRSKLILLRMEQIKIYEIAHRNRRMLTDLYDQRRTIYDAKLARLEQAGMDDAFNARLHRR
ncbi:MAG TPA: hypothetical protein VGD59_08570 [Acidisarcina sp.]